MSLCRVCGLIMHAENDSYICSECGYTYRKGEHNARILDILANADGPITVRIIQGSTSISISTVKKCLERLCMQRRIEKHPFKGDMHGADYRTYEKGKSPKYYYRITPLGHRLLEYYESKKLV